MKKRLLSALLALALVFVLLPTTALADTTPVTDENVKINGTAVIVGNDISLGEGNGTYSYDKATHTLTLNSATITTTGNIGISFGVPVKGNINYKIELIGTNTISSTSAQAIYVEYDSGLDQQGTQKLSTLTINGSAGSSLILNASGYEKEAIWSKGDFTLSGGTAVTAFSSGKIAVNVGSMTINNSKLSAQSSSYGTTVVLYGLKMIGDTAEFEALNTSSVVSAVLGTSGASENTDWSNYQFTTGSYSGGVLTKSDPEVCSRETLNKYLGLSQKEKSQYIHIAKRTIPALQRTSDVLIAGKNAVVGVETSIPSANGSGTYFYDQASKTLTLNNVTITSGTNAIQFAAAGTYTVKLEGTNKISNVSNGISVTDDKYITSLNVTITGTGSLDISAKGLAINMKKGDLKFENTGAIKLATSSIGLNNNALSVKGNITITDMSKYSVTGTQQTGGKPLGSEVSLTEASQLKGGTTGYRIITITPAAAKPSTIRYNGTTLKQGEIIKDENGGTATVATKGNTITLNNFKGTKALSFEATLADSTLVLEGTNTLSSIVTTQKGLTISGSGSLTVGSIRVTNNDNIRADLTITGGAHVTVNRPSEDKPAVEVSGNLTVTGEGTQLSAECTAATNPAIEVGGNVTISGDPGTNAYTVKAYNKYAIQRGRDDKLRPSQMPSAFEISGNLSISGSAQVMAQTDSDGAAVWMPKQKVISVVDASLIAQNRSHNFSTISFGDESNMGNIYAKGQEVNIVAENMLGSNSRLAHRAIKAFIYNHYNTGGSNPYYIKVVSEGVQSGGNVNVIPGDCTSTGGYKVTITRGDAYTTPQVAANYTIAGQTMHVGQYYKTDANGNITDGTAQDYNIYCDSENDFTLNNATISSTGTDVAINTNIRYETNVQHHIKLIGTNRINNTFKHAISAGSNSSTIIIEGVGNASDASLTINGNFLPIYSDGKVIINAEVVIVNTTDDNSFKGLISTSDGKGAFDLGSGYKCYASTSTTGTPLEEFNSANYGTYKYLRVTTQTLETGGGSTHQHTWDTSKWYSVGDDYHARKCTGCDEYDLTNKQAHYAWPDEDKGPEGHTEKCMLCDYKYDQSVIKPHEWTGWWVSDYQPEVHAQRCNCGYQGSTHRTLKYVAINSEQHQKQCPVDGCGYKIEYKTSHVYEEGSNICTECGYDKSAPCNHTGDRVYTNNGDGTHKVTCKACGATIVEKETHEFDPTGACVCGATQSGGNPTPDNPGTIVIIRPAEEEKPAQQPNPSTGANDLVGMAVAAAVVAVLGSVALLRKHD